MIKSDDFEKGEDRRGIRLSQDGLRKFLRAYEEVMTRPQDEDEASVAAGMRGTFLAQLGQLLDAIAGRAPYLSHLEVPAKVSPNAVSGVL